MRAFKHKNTGEILNLNESHSAFSVVEKSPSWEEITEEVVEVTEVEPTDKKTEGTPEEIVEVTEEVTEEAPEAKPKTNKKK